MKDFEVEISLDIILNILYKKFITNPQLKQKKIAERRDELPLMIKCNHSVN